MKQQLNEVKRWQKLAGILNESQLSENTKHTELKPLEDILIQNEYKFAGDDSGFSGKATYQKEDDEVSLFKDYEEDMGADRGKTFPVRIIHFKNGKTLSDKNYTSIDGAKKDLEGISKL